MTDSKVLVIGDIIIDKYIHGVIERLSPEAPVPIIKQINVIEKLGGAGLVFENLLSLGASAELLPISDRSIKTRVYVGNRYMYRIDDDCKSKGIDTLKLIEKINFSEFEYVILSDYNKGVLDYSKEIIEYINSFGSKIIVDPKKHSSYYKGAWLVKPNYKEYVDLEFFNWDANIVITNAENPVTARLAGEAYISNSYKTEVVDVTGAGDCFLATLVYGLVKKYNFQKCLDLANKACSFAIRNSGTYIIKPSDLWKQ